MCVFQRSPSTLALRAARCAYAARTRSAKTAPLSVAHPAHAWAPLAPRPTPAPQQLTSQHATYSTLLTCQRRPPTERLPTISLPAPYRITTGYDTPPQSERSQASVRQVRCESRLTHALQCTLAYVTPPPSPGPWPPPPPPWRPRPSPERRPTWPAPPRTSPPPRAAPPAPSRRRPEEGKCSKYNVSITYAGKVPRTHDLLLLTAHYLLRT